MPNNLNVNDISLAVNRLLDEAQGITREEEANMLYITVSNVELSEYGTIFTLDKTWQEIHDAFVAGTTCLVHAEYTTPDEYDVVEDRYVVEVDDYHDNPDTETLHYYVSIPEVSGNMRLACDSPDDYPVTQA